MNSILILLMLINMSRITPLETYPLLSQHATQRAELIYRTGNFSHNNWRDSFYGTDCYYGGENLAKGYTDMIELHGDFMRSAGHRKNILSTNFNSVGVGIYGNIIVELFCAR